MNNSEMLLFLAKLPDSFQKLSIQKNNFFNYKEMLLQENECIFVIDFSRNKLVYAKGFLNTFGYSDQEVDLEMLIHNIHPEDVELVNRIGRASILFAIEQPHTPSSNILNLTYRWRKKDGNYAKILSQSVILRTAENGSMARSLVKLTDISFIDSSNHVFWDFRAKGLNKKEFKKHIYAPFKDLFTKRELDVIKLLKENIDNEEIAQKLHISKNTVTTHRKNIFRKSNCHNLPELMVYCQRHGFI